MRKVNIGSEDFTVIHTHDKKAFNTYHDYHINKVDSVSRMPSDEVGVVKFQKGPIKEYGVNGCHNEDLIAIVIDRLQQFQESAYNCRENALAITKLEEAMHWLKHRTDARKVRGVEGTHKI